MPLCYTLYFYVNIQTSIEVKTDSIDVYFDDIELFNDVVVNKFGVPIVGMINANLPESTNIVGIYGLKTIPKGKVCYIISYDMCDVKPDFLVLRNMKLY